ncbi:MAG: sugar phosphate isomerase/epimerase family protein [Chloroflexota bacterium]
MDPEPFVFSVSEFTTYPWTFERDVETYAQLNVDAIEVCEFKLDPARIVEQLSSIRPHGLTISSVQPSVRTLYPSRSQPEPVRVPDRVDQFRQTIDRFQSFAEGVPFIANTGIPPNGNMQEVFEVAARQYRTLADFASEHGARVALEPLNASIMNVESTIWSIQQGMRIVEAVARDNFGLCVDLWNVWQNAHIEDAIEAAGDRVFIVQVSDWRTPRSFEDRLIVGQGDIPFAPLLRAVQESGYRGPFELEIFSGDVPDSLWKDDLSQVITESRKGLERAWGDAFPPV